MEGLEVFISIVTNIWGKWSRQPDISRGRTKWKVKVTKKVIRCKKNKMSQFWYRFQCWNPHVATTTGYKYICQKPFHKIRQQTVKIYDVHHICKQMLTVAIACTEKTLATFDLDPTSNRTACRLIKVSAIGGLKETKKQRNKLGEN